jgi:hypothetical protein
MNSQKYIQTLDDNIWPVVTKHFGNNTWYFQDALGE